MSRDHDLLDGQPLKLERLLAYPDVNHESGLGHQRLARGLPPAWRIGSAVRLPCHTRLCCDRAQRLQDGMAEPCSPSNRAGKM